MKEIYTKNIQKVLTQKAQLLNIDGGDLRYRVSW